MKMADIYTGRDRQTVLNELYCVDTTIYIDRKFAPHQLIRPMVSYYEN